MNIFDLPEDILLHIITFLFWEDYERLCLTSKTLHEMLNTLSIHLHLYELELPYDGTMNVSPHLQFLNEDVDSISSDDVRLDFLYN